MRKLFLALLILAPSISSAGTGDEFFGGDVEFQKQVKYKGCLQGIGPQGNYVMAVSSASGSANYVTLDCGGNATFNGRIYPSASGLIFPDGSALTTAFGANDWTNSGTVIYTSATALGVGSTSPQATIHISSGAIGLLVDGNGATAFKIGVTTLTVLGSGSVGIGTSSPQKKLHISSGTLLIDGNTTNSIITSGRVGIGNTNPTVPLSIQSVGGDNIYLLGRDNFPADEAAITFRNFANNQTNGTLNGTGGQFQISGGVSSGTNVTSGNFGINAPNPTSKLHLSSGTLLIDGNVAPSISITAGSNVQSTSVLTISSNNATAMFKFDNSAHMIVDGTVPTTGANCAVNTGSTDMAGSVTISGGATSSCAITFAVPFANTPFCTGSDQSAATAIRVLPATTSVTLSFAVAANDTLSWICIGR